MQLRAKKERLAKSQEDDKSQVHRLILDMNAATDDDSVSLTDPDKNLQATYRFKMLGQVDAVLKKKPNLMTFLDAGGLTSLEKWLKPNSDQSYAPIQVIELVLELLERLPVELHHLESSGIARVLQLYVSGKAFCGPKIAAQATSLLQRWQVGVYNLSYEYDERGLHELKQRELRRKLEVLRGVDESDFTGRAVCKEDELIRKAPNGLFIMQKSNFDFLEKPESCEIEKPKTRVQFKKGVQVG